MMNYILVLEIVPKAFGIVISGLPRGIIILCGLPGLGYKQGRFLE